MFALPARVCLTGARNLKMPNAYVHEEPFVCPSSRPARARLYPRNVLPPPDRSCRGIHRVPQRPPCSFAGMITAGLLRERLNGFACAVTKRLEHDRLLSRIPAVEDLQAAWLLLRSCACPRANHRHLHGHDLICFSSLRSEPSLLHSLSTLWPHSLPTCAGCKHPLAAACRCVQPEPVRAGCLCSNLDPPFAVAKKLFFLKVESEPLCWTCSFRPGGAACVLSCLHV